MTNIFSSTILIMLIVGIYFYIKDRSEHRKKIPFDIKYEKRD